MRAKGYGVWDFPIPHNRPYPLLIQFIAEEIALIDGNPETVGGDNQYNNGSKKCNSSTNADS